MEQKKTMADHEGLTRPLINNIGGMIDQDAPSADQLMGGRDEDVLDNAGAVEGGREPHVGGLLGVDAGTIMGNQAGGTIGSGSSDGPHTNPD